MAKKKITHALCFGNPICSKICNGVKYSFDILVGVGFFLGGKVAIFNTFLCL